MRLLLTRRLLMNFVRLKRLQKSIYLEMFAVDSIQQTGIIFILREFWQSSYLLQVNEKIVVELQKRIIETVFHKFLTGILTIFSHG